MIKIGVRVKASRGFFLYHIINLYFEIVSIADIVIYKTVVQHYKINQFHISKYLSL
jgi:hypothetical protein